MPKPLPVNKGVAKRSKGKAISPFLFIFLLVVLAVGIVAVAHFAFHVPLGTLMQRASLVPHDLLLIFSLLKLG